MKKATQFSQLTYYVECPYCGHSHADDAPWAEADHPEKIDCAKCGEYFLAVTDEVGDDE